MADLKKFAEELVNLSVKEVTNWRKYLKMSMESNRQLQLLLWPVPAASSEKPAAEEKSTFDVILKAQEDRSYRLFKLVKDITGLD